MEHVLKTEKFLLKIEPEIFTDDIEYPVNTQLRVAVQSGGFSASASMDIDIEDFAKFTYDLAEIYHNLSGEAKIAEPYGKEMFISFEGDGKGHIFVKGFLFSRDEDDCEQSLEFENRFDQTYLEAFCKDMIDLYGKYA